MRYVFASEGRRAFRNLIVITSAGLLLSTGAASAQILSDGDLDALTPGTAPDCDAANGAWLFPDNYVNANPTACETTPDDFTVVVTDSFDPGAPGNSLQLNISDPNDAINPHLTNLFTQVINEADGVVTTVTFDIFVPEKGRGGGSIYVGGDHGGGGYSNGTDRGPQVAWFNDGTMVANVAGVQTPLGAFNYGEWQSVRFEIDLATDTFDMYHGARGGELTQIADDLKFRVAALDHLDRFSMAHFGATVDSDRSYVDNVVVSIPGDDCYPDFTGDGLLDLFDFLGFVNAFNAGEDKANCDGEGGLDLFDFLCFTNAFNAGC